MLYKRHFLALFVLIALLHTPIIVLEILRASYLQVHSFDSLFKLIVAKLAPSLATQALANPSLDQIVLWMLSGLGIALLHFMFTGQLSAALLTHILVLHQRLPRLQVRQLIGLDGRTWISCLATGGLAVLFGCLLATLSIVLVRVAQSSVSQAFPNYWNDPQQSMLWLLLVGGLSLVCLVVSLILLLRLLFFPEVIVVERAGLISSLQRSWKLTGSALWRVLGSATLIWMLILIASSIATTSLSFIVHVIFQEALQNRQLSHIIDRVLYHFSLIVLTPFQLAAYIMLYFELRKRQEGLASRFE